MNYLLLRDSIELPPNELSPKKATLKELRKGSSAKYVIFSNRPSES